MYVQVARAEHDGVERRARVFLVAEMVRRQRVKHFCPEEVTLFSHERPP